ncbi:hypothetical protein ACS3UN_03465 [Oscillospiraceae bacterium LTW-04]|nr:hypothetical protein RBH76_07000 [Oscillospiraceae bacterium MB24-C1]
MNIILNAQQACGTDVLPLVGVAESYEYDSNGNKGKLIGTTYTILNPQDRCTSLRVKVADTTLVVSQEELDQHNKLLQFVMVRFSNFTAKPYAHKTSGMQLSCTADKAVIVTGNSK